MTNNQLTKEWLQQTIAELESVRDEIPFGIDTNSELELAAFKLALAAMDSEPVAYWRKALRADGFCYADGINSKRFHDENPPFPLEDGDYWEIIPLYRHAQSAPEYPEKLPCPVLLEPGMRFGKGVKTRLVLEAIQRSAAHYAELEAMTPEERAEYDAGIEAFKAMLPQPTPVVPAVPDKELSDDVLDGIIAGAKTSMEQYLALSLKAEREAWRQSEPTDDERIMDIEGIIPGLDEHVRYESNAGGNLWIQCSRHKFEKMKQAGMLTRMLYERPEAGNSPVIPDGYVLVPMRLTAENGAKGALSGEFSETKFVNCPECFGDDECETCDGSGRIEITVPITWTTIKEIWAKGVEHFAAASTEE